MTKKTNSLLFRFGLNILWINKSINNNFIINVSQLENIISKILKKKNLKVLRIHYKYNIIHIDVYHYLNNESSLYNEFKIYFCNTLSITKTIAQFGISKNYIKWFLQNIQIKFQKPTKIIIPIYAYLIFLILYIKKKIKYCLDIYNKLKFNKIFWIVQILIYLIQKPNILKSILNSNTHIYRFKIRKIYGLLQFKLLSIYLENIILKFFFYVCRLSINNILYKKSLFIQYKIINKSTMFMFQTVVLGILYNNTKIIAEYVSFLILQNKNHKQSLKKFVSIIEKCFFFNIIKFKGFQLRLNGKLIGKMRKSKYHYKLGKVQLQILKIVLNFSTSISYTKFGTISIKTWLLQS